MQVPRGSVGVRMSNSGSVLSRWSANGQASEVQPRPHCHITKSPHSHRHHPMNKNRLALRVEHVGAVALLGLVLRRPLPLPLDVALGQARGALRWAEDGAYVARRLG